jgi:arylsulfatase A-like enzyme
LGNKFFDRRRLFYADYNTTATYRDVDGDYQAPTLYEILDDKFSVTIQSPVRRGVYRKIDNWASSGLRWFFGQIPEIDCLTAERFELIGEIARKAKRWPDLIFAYFPATDEMGHRYGPDSKEYHQNLINVDEQIGRIAKALQANGLLEKTYFAFVTDHGMAGCGKDNYINISRLLTDEFDWRLTSKGPNSKVHFSSRADYFSRYNAVLVNGGYRRGILYLRNGDDWSLPARPDQVQPVARFLAKQEAVCLTAYPDSGEGIWVENNLGRARIERNAEINAKSLNNKQYRYLVVDGQDPLGYDVWLRETGLLDGIFHTGVEWLAGSLKSEFPDLPVQIIEMFDSHRAGDLIVFARDGWDFDRSNLGGHGSAVATDMLVPMVFSGPGILPGSTIPAARTVDVAPTVIEMLDKKKLDVYDFDGRSLLEEMMRKQ